jgi:glycosyltransferase involved in cell wall biosynthesis
LILKKLLACNYKVTLRLIGDGQDLIPLKYLAHKLGLTNSVELTGFQSELQVIEHLSNADIYLSTSAAEGLANSVLEASACSLPVVAFDAEGMNEIVVPDRSGYIIDYGNIDSAVEKISFLFDNPMIRLEFGKYGRSHVVENFDSKVHLSSMISFYESISK